MTVMSKNGYKPNRKMVSKLITELGFIKSGYEDQSIICIALRMKGRILVLQASVLE